jgi:hypothetical protein
MFYRGGIDVEGGEEIKLRISMAYVTVFETLYAILNVALASLPFTLFVPADNRLYDVSWSLAFLFIATIFFGRVLWGYQTATLDENGIAFRSVMRMIIKIRWTDIVKADTRFLRTLTTRYSYYPVEWIVLYTANDQEPEDGRRNKKNKPPWKIIYNKKNFKTINDFLKRYSNTKRKVR